MNEHKFNDSLDHCENPLYPCSLEVEFTIHFLLCCHNFVNTRNTFLNKLTADLKFLKKPAFKIKKSGGFSDTAPCKITGLLMKEVVPSAKEALLTLG